MARNSLNIARQYGEKLELFNSLDEAEQSFSLKTLTMKSIIQINKDN